MAQLEGPDRAVLVGRPAFGQLRAEHQVRPVPGQELAHLLKQHQTAGVRDADRLDRSRRHLLPDPQGTPGGGTDRPDQPSHAERRCDGAQKRERQAEQAAMAQEFAPADATVDEAVDQMGFERIATTPDGVDKPQIPRHRCCSGIAAFAAAPMLHAASGYFNGVGGSGRLPSVAQARPVPVADLSRALT